MSSSDRRSSSLGFASSTRSERVLGRAPERDSLEAERTMAAVAARLFEDGAPTDVRTLGRFELRERVGQGGMGFVYSGWDPDLARRVAIKVVRPRIGSDDGHERLLAEARTLARIQHPNVVTILDAGRTGDRVWLAMEFIPRSLATWLKTRPEPSAIVDAFRQAARGLLAAHRAGLVHRDFKPSNVLLRDDDSVAVADFGLARLVGDMGSAAVAGTLFFMSPEQLDGRPIDARSDQYSWCVALYQALYSEHPYLGESVAIRRSSARPKKPEVRGPKSRVDMVLERGLCEDPADRFGDMEALLAALEPRSRSWGWIAAAGVGAAAAAAVIAVPEPAEVTCEQVASKLRGSWGSAQRNALAERFALSSAPLAEDATASVTAALDDYAQHWSGARVAACEASREPSVVMTSVELDRRIACLDDRVADFDALVEALLDADARTVERASRAVDELPSLSRCENDEALRSSPKTPEDPELAAKIAELRERLARARSRYRLGHYEVAGTLAREVRRDVTRSESAPLWAAAARLEGRSLNRRGEHERGAALVEEAGLLSQAVGDDDGALDAARIQIRHRAEFAPFSRAEVDWARLGAAMLERLGTPPDAAMNWYQAVATAKVRRHDLVGALEAVKLAEGFASVAAPPQSPRRGNLAMTRGGVLTSLGRFDEALESFEYARDVYGRSLGTSHPAYASVVQNIGAAYTARGDKAKGRQHFVEALGTMEALLGTDSTQLADYHYNIAVVDYDLGRLDDAEREMTRAQQMYIEELGPEHPYVGSAHEELGRIDLKREDHEAAREHYERALQIKEAALGPDNPEVILSLRGLARLAIATGRAPEGLELYERIYAMTEATYGDRSDRTADAAINLSNAARAVGDMDRARAEAKRGVAIFESLDVVEPEWVADARFTLATATWPVDAQEARRQVELARDAYAEGDKKTEALEWLEAHPAPK